MEGKVQVSERESTCNRGEVHIRGEAHARQEKYMHVRQKGSTHARAGKHTCGKESTREKALERRQKKGKLHEMGCTSDKHSI